jgi:hypothetical protein
MDGVIGQYLPMAWRLQEGLFLAKGSLLRVGKISYLSLFATSNGPRESKYGNWLAGNFGSIAITSTLGTVKQSKRSNRANRLIETFFSKGSIVNVRFYVLAYKNLI